ncbi:disulfide bond formation protein B [Blastochloris viridis]|uniref:Disulfide bond formation protein DsbB n=1 Tax=Blastochloris viridis TaxID=1079 RepID=A0A0P0IWF7_BLAVI|nr:disulfide bond formation protein B [Blastochloris viridis]ALK08079.1 Disulfide bond formation protein B [Blastochloris viridis]CUU44001.1 Disulfide bond formation protein DsbB [Blastochloris viridis]
MSSAASQTPAAGDRSHARATVAAATVVVVGASALAAAWGMELIGGLPPCHLCLLQRVPYYVGLPVAAAVGLGAWRGLPLGWLRLGLALVALAMLATAGIAGYHAGVEWRWWPGPSDCSGPALAPFGSVTDLMAQMQSAHVVRCDEPALVLFGLSLAGWNALLSLALAMVALRGALARPA